MLKIDFIDFGTHESQTGFRREARSILAKVVMKLKNKNVLVTGAGGFIGSHLVEELVNLGAEVRAFVHYNSRNDWGLLEFLPKSITESIEVYLGDIQDPFIVKQACEEQDIVFHLAALIGIPYSYIAPESYVNTNVSGTLNVMQACLDESVAKVVTTSTSEVYGTAQYTPIDEKHPIVAQSPYSASKIGADKIAESYYRSFKLPVSIIRPFNTYGSRQSARAVIPTIITQALTKEKIILGSTEPIRDLTYVRDTIDGFIKIAESKRSIGEVINIGYGSGVSIKELIQRITTIIGEDISFELDKCRVRPEKSEVMVLVCDNKKARKLLGWKPTFNLEKGLSETVDWIRDNLGYYKLGLYTI